MTLTMGLMFFLIGMVPDVAHMFSVFIVLYGLSYFFAEFGPNTTTFILPAEVFPVNLRTTGHGFSAGSAKVGAFLGAFLFPILYHALGLSNTLKITFLFSLAGLLITAICLKEPSGKTLEDISNEDKKLDALAPSPVSVSH